MESYGGDIFAYLRDTLSKRIMGAFHPPPLVPDLTRPANAPPPPPASALHPPLQ
jgi:hypothetical protein